MFFTGNWKSCHCFSTFPPLNFPAEDEVAWETTNRTQILLITTSINFFLRMQILILFFCCIISLTIVLSRSPPAFLESRKYLMSAALQKPVSPKLCNQVQDGAMTTNTTVSSPTHCTCSALPPGKNFYLPEVLNFSLFYFSQQMGNIGTTWVHTACI